MTINATKRPRARGTKVSVERATLENVRAILERVERGEDAKLAASRLLGVLELALGPKPEPKPAPRGFGEGP